jgi:hypothetical protein
MVQLHKIERRRLSREASLPYVVARPTRLFYSRRPPSRPAASGFAVTLWTHRFPETIRFYFSADGSSKRLGVFGGFTVSTSVITEARGGLKNAMRGILSAQETASAPEPQISQPDALLAVTTDYVVSLAPILTRYGRDPVRSRLSNPPPK